MNVKGSNRAKRRKADQFLWYWKPPFNDPKSPFRFDREHWWKKSPDDLSHDAALYELLRRHPKVGELQSRCIRFSHEFWLTTHYIAMEMLLHCVGLRSWPKLSKDERSKFQSTLRAAWPGKGQILTKRVWDLTKEARAWAESEKDVGGPSVEECMGDLAKRLGAEGRLILAVDTDFGSKREAKAALKKIPDIFWKYWHKPCGLVRARWEDWCLVITAFENEFAVEGDAKFKLGYPTNFKRFIGLFASVSL